jgi:HSP20 family protein
MAAQTKGSDQQNQQSGGQTLTQGSQRQGAPSWQTGALGLPLTPATFFRLNPFTLMRRMTEEFDCVFGETGGREQTERAWMPTVEVRQTEGNYIVRAELPGINPGDVKLEITDEAIVMQGERKMQRDEEEEGGVHVTERRYGRFYRAIPLPEGAKSEQARAKVENGVLEITVPVEERRSKRREIPIEGALAQAGKPAASTESRGGSEKAA